MTSCIHLTPEPCDLSIHPLRVLCKSCGSYFGRNNDDYLYLTGLSLGTVSKAEEPNSILTLTAGRAQQDAWSTICLWSSKRPKHFNSCNNIEHSGRKSRETKHISINEWRSLDSDDECEENQDQLATADHHIDRQHVTCVADNLSTVFR